MNSSRMPRSPRADLAALLIGHQHRAYDAALRQPGFNASLAAAHVANVYVDEILVLRRAERSGVSA